mmetsp:Transcript_19694/g.28984  ORF Transcript_19694/g.28984 Transcript_19694/m.28984 type:complete len:286 (-) Transcript_19694:1909-2766(-)
MLARCRKRDLKVAATYWTELLRVLQRGCCAVRTTHFRGAFGCTATAAGNCHEGCKSRLASRRLSFLVVCLDSHPLGLGAFRSVGNGLADANPSSLAAKSNNIRGAVTTTVADSCNLGNVDVVSIFILLQRIVLQSASKNIFVCFWVSNVHKASNFEATKDGFIEVVRSIRRPENCHASFSIELAAQAVPFLQKHVDDLAIEGASGTTAVAADTASGAQEGVHLVNENDTGRVLPGDGKQCTDCFLAVSGPLAVDGGSRNVDKSCSRLSRHSFRKHGFTGARGTVE